MDLLLYYVSVRSHASRMQTHQRTVWRLYIESSKLTYWQQLLVSVSAGRLWFQPGSRKPESKREIMIHWGLPKNR